ncbi:DUF7935 family protein [Dyadobacter sandarakinus]|uniref:LemA family protein n=1 Tax=Dyadobacter sandarakinus TaxID=2747268 RepID=A0ABX7I6I9_9BACT|nr:hypothetical protein [Dyadobacter sandarakinus]QRR01712.1 hypothetical protein HWI92_12725 [Dyadobacter sandarakinus]
MDYLWLLIVLLIAVAVIYGTYLTITTVAEKIFEKQRWEIRSKNVEITLPLRLQAYERMCIFLERISPNNLLLRTTVTATSAVELQEIVLMEIRNEYNHNVAQQLYMSQGAWEQVTAAMNETVAAINQAAAQVPAEAPAAELAKQIFAQIMGQEAQPVTRALGVLREEIRMLF